MNTILSAVVLFSAMFWNVENYFDYFDGGNSASDKEFSQSGEKHWTKKKFYDKANLIGKTILFTGAPDVVGLAEIENSFVLKRLIGTDVLRKYNYSYVHYESGDRRGIDVALLYRSDSLRVLESYPIHIDGIRTRDILYARLQHKRTCNTWNIYVNHHPSKYGGSSSDAKRVTAMTALKHSIDSLVAGDSSQRIIAMGDFNDTPFSQAFEIMQGVMVNLGRQVDKVNSGTIRYRGNWELIDNFLISPSLYNGDNKEEVTLRVLSPQFLLERDRQFPGLKPKRTYIGPRYNYGVSDHLPIIVSF